MQARGWRNPVETDPINHPAATPERSGVRLQVAVKRLAPVRQDAFDLRHIFITDALAAAIAAFQTVEDVLPHDARRLEASRPFTAPLDLPAELPDAGEALGAEEAPLARFRI